MKKGQTAEGFVIRTDFPNKGIVQVEEPGQEERQAAPLAVVKNALPRQRIRFRVTKKRKGRLEGDLLEVLEASPKEIPSDCPHFPGCGGCFLRTLPYEEQLALKAGQAGAILAEACGESGDIPSFFEGILPSPDVLGYRNKMEFSFGDAFRDGPLCLGLHKKGSFYDIITTDNCRIVHGDFRLILTTVLELVREYGLPYYHKVRHTGYLRHLLVRRGRNTGEILVGLVTATVPVAPDTSCFAADRSEADFLMKLRERLLALATEGEIVGILHIVNDSISDTITPERIEVLWGRDCFYDRLGDLQFRISPFSFFQTNTAGAEVLYRKVCEYAQAISMGIGEENVPDGRGPEIFDLYSGTGTIAQMLSPVAGHVTGVEIVEEAVEAARQNAALNGLTNCDFIAGDVLRVVDELKEKPDLIILDPPRDGVHPKALQKIIGFGVRDIVYISCKITSLARDLEMLQEAGYRVKRACCVDMFPATANLETIIKLSLE